MARPGPKVIDPIERFNTKYVVDPITGCWNWTALLNSHGYGLFRKDKIVSSHRFSYEYYVGPLKEGLVICHNCSNRKCCNPDHLRQDTQKSNQIDMVKIKKQRLQILSVEEVIEIKKALKHYYRGQCKDIAHFYKVNIRTISEIKTGKKWSHVVID